MKTVSFETIKAAKENDIEAAEQIKKHFESFIMSRCTRRYVGPDGQLHKYIDEDLRCLAEIALYAAIFRFQFADPPDDFEP